jgi:hypothetical protein
MNHQNGHNRIKRKGLIMKTTKTKEELRCKFFPQSKKCDNCQQCKNLDDFSDQLLELITGLASERK